MRKEPGVKVRDESATDRSMPAGIVIRAEPETEAKPVISAFIWGGKVRQVPTLPYGRWRSTAA
jgi:hypothetical protein